MDVSSRILWIKFKFSRFKVYAVARYGPSHGDGEETETFWNGLGRFLDKADNGYRSCVLRDQRKWIGDRVRAGITDAF